MQIIDQGTVQPARPKTDASSLAFGSICVLQTGRWIAGMRAAPAKNGRTSMALITCSDDQGATWSDPVQPMPPIEWDGKPGTWRSVVLTALGGSHVAAVLYWEDMSDPLLPMYNEQTEGVVEFNQLLIISEDGGATWSPPRRISFGRFDHLPVVGTGAVVPLPDGRWMFTFEVNKPYYDTSPWQHHSGAVYSEDRGDTWSEAVVTHTDPTRRVFCWDQRAAVLRDGRVFVAYWTFDREDAVYLNIHAAESTDGGQTFSDVWDTSVPGQPAPVVDIGDGRIVMVYVDRTDRPTIKARLSTNGGRTFDAQDELVIHDRGVESQTVSKDGMNDAWSEMNAYSVGLPSATRLGDDEVLAVYYTGPHADQTDLQWVRLGA